MPCRSRWSGARLSSTAASGASASVSSSWNEDASQTTTAAGVEGAGQAAERGADVARDRHRHAGLAVDPAHELGGRRLPVGAGDRRSIGLGSSRQPSSSSPTTGIPRARAARIDRRLLRHAGALDHGARAVQQRDAVGLARARRRRRRPARRALPGRRARRRSHAPPRRCARSACAAARARAGEADDQERAGRQRRAGAHGGHSSGRAGVAGGAGAHAAWACRGRGCAVADSPPRPAAASPTAATRMNSGTCGQGRCPSQVRIAHLRSYRTRGAAVRRGPRLAAIAGPAAPPRPTRGTAKRPRIPAHPPPRQRPPVGRTRAAGSARPPVELERPRPRAAGGPPPGRRARCRRPCRRT